MSNTVEFPTVTISLGDLAKKYEKGFLCHLIERMVKPKLRERTIPNVNLLQVFCRDFPDVCEIGRVPAYRRQLIESGCSGPAIELCIDPKLIEPTAYVQAYRQELLALLVERYGENHMLNFIVKVEG